MWSSGVDSTGAEASSLMIAYLFVWGKRMASALDESALRESKDLQDEYQIEKKFQNIRSLRC